MSFYIEAKNIVARYDDTEVLENVSLAAEKGSTCAVLGASGCGKSTLLKIIAGLKKATSGEVFIAGKKRDAKQNDIGFMPQKSG